MASAAHTAAYIAIDWGTTNRRTYLMATDGTVIDTIRDGAGVLSVAREAYPGELRNAGETW